MIKPTPHQLDLLSLLAGGLTGKEAGVRLGISEHTVKHLLTCVRGKLGAETSTQAVAICLRKGWIK